jgi:hypothetical protein
VRRALAAPYLILVSSELLYDFVHALIYGRVHVAAPVRGNEGTFTLGGYDDLDNELVRFGIQNHFGGLNVVVVPGQSGRFGFRVLPYGIRNFHVPRLDRYVHVEFSLSFCCG